MTANKPEFKSFSPFKVPTEAVDDYATRRNIPTTVFPQAVPDVQPAPAATRLVKLSVDVPDYVMKRLKQRALDEDRSHRALVLRALMQYGIEVTEEDVIDDRRRNNKQA
jgi:hypothetical protein